MSMSTLDTFKQIITTNGHRLTNARLATFNLLVDCEPQSVSALLVKAKKSVDRVSVYRNLALFEQLGIVNRVYIGWKFKLELSDAFIAHHHHLSCLTCGKIIAIDDETYINAFIEEVSKKVGFSPRHHQFEVDGYCRECKDK